METHQWTNLLDRESSTWCEAKHKAGRVRDHLLAFSTAVQSQGGIHQLPAPIQIDLRGRRRYEAIAIIAYVLNQKLKLRGPHYLLEYSRRGADPYPVTFICRNGHRHRMKSNYNGGSDQVGNFIAETETFPGNWTAVSYNNVSNIDDVDFLLMCEIARRKTEDPQRNVPDLFRSSLPISFCVAVGIELIRRNVITVATFLTGQYCCFRGDQRINRAELLLAGALQMLGNGHLNKIVSDYYELYEHD